MPVEQEENEKEEREDKEVEEKQLTRFAIRAKLLQKKVTAL